MIDLSREKNYLLIAAILSLLSGAKILGVIISIAVIVLEYLAFSGFEEKLGLSKPKEYYVRSIIAAIIGAIIMIGAVAAIISSELSSGATYDMEDVYMGSSISGTITNITAFSVSTTTGTDAVPDKGAPVIICIAAVAWILLLVSVWYSTKAYVELGNFFGIEEFEKYRMCALALFFGLPLWIVLAVAVIGIFIILGLAIAGIAFKILGITKIPEKYEKRNDTAPATPAGPVIY